VTGELVAHVAAGLLLVMLGAVGAFLVMAKAVAKVIRELRDQARHSIDGEAERDFGNGRRVCYYEADGRLWLGFTAPLRK
jgi:hypothetical protein